MRRFLTVLIFLLSVAGFAQTDTLKTKEQVDGATELGTDSIILQSADQEITPQPQEVKQPETIQQPTVQQVQEQATIADSNQKQPGDTLKKTGNRRKYALIRASPDSIKYRMLDELTPEQLMEYYVTEPDPPSSPKGHPKLDSIFNVLNPLTIPTTTVEGEPLFRVFSEPEAIDSAFSASEQQMRPKVGIGLGRLGYHGDIYERNWQSPLLGRPAFDLAISQRLTRFLQLDFSVLMGKIGANENLGPRHMNMLTEIRAGGVNLIYDFGNFIPDKYRVRPFLSFGAYGFEFLSKTDLRDKDGNLYHYWSDGSIRDRAEGSADAQSANEIHRDFTYESDVREQNSGGFGKYRESAWSFPVGAGVIMKVTDRVDMKINLQYYLSTTDDIDGIRKNIVEGRAGNKRNDNFSYLSVGLQYDLIAKKPKRKKSALDTIDINDPYFLALLTQDNDNDSIPDVDDACPGTPANVAVDKRGCPLDGDNDAVPDFRDDELATLPGLAVNTKGVGQGDAYWQTWYDGYMNDSLGGEKLTEYTGNIYAMSKKKSDRKDPYTVELVRYNGAIPSDELAFLLSIGDINSTTLEDGATVVYTSGNYEKIGAAVKRRDEFREEGNKKAGVSMFKDKDIIQLPEAELESLLHAEIEDLLKVNVNDTSYKAAQTATATTPDEDFKKDEIVYRVQLGAFRNKISTSVFGASTGVLELKTGENVYRYVTKGYKTIEEAAATRADLVVQGYSDAFVTAYRGGRRIPMSETKATVQKDYKEDLNEDKTFSSIDKSLLVFKIQLGPLKKRTQEESMDARVKSLENVQKQVTSSGSLRYTVGNFAGLEVAEEFRKEIEGKGFSDAFIIATFKGEIISMQEAMELLK